MKIHVIEDEVVLLNAIRIALDRAGHTVTISTEGTGAAAETIKSNPDIVIVDIFLPGINGFDVIKQLRSELPELPVIVFTNSNTEEFDKDLLKSLDVKQTLVKASTSLSELIAAVNKATA